MRIYTRKGDDGTTGLLYGGRVAKSSPVIAAAGAVDEAQAALGLVRAEVDRGCELDQILVGLERDLYVLMAELATDPSNRWKLAPGKSLVTPEMVDDLESRIDALSGAFPPLAEFVIPGHDRVSALLDLSRTAVRRAERAALEALGAQGDGAGNEVESAGAGEDQGGAGAGEGQGGASAGEGQGGASAGEGQGGASAGSQVLAYLNRLSDLVWTMARWQEHGDSLLSRRAGGKPGVGAGEPGVGAGEVGGDQGVGGNEGSRGDQGKGSTL